MAKDNLACAITMVRDDYFFLERWIAYYSKFFGRKSLYIVNHGGNPEVDRIADGCNVIAIPDEFAENFDALRWRMLTNLGNALRNYFKFVIINDVDEFVVVDPKRGQTLDKFLSNRRGSLTITPIGLEVIHQVDQETEDLSSSMLGPRRFARFTTAYSKPCIFNHQIRFSRGGHYADDPELRIFGSLFLFHMRYVDQPLYHETLGRRAMQMKRIEKAEDSNLSWYWRKGASSDPSIDRVFDLPIGASFNFETEADNMRNTWSPRSDHGLFSFERQINPTLCEIPERFFGIV